MTWYADEIILRATPAALRVILGDATLARVAYHVTPESGLGHGSRASVPHLPKDGLLFLRPICDPDPEEGGAGWYDVPVLDWNAIPPRADQLLPDPCTVAAQTGYSELVLPPPPLRSLLTWLTRETGEPVVFYSCFMWGGEIGHEYAWVAGSTNSAVVALRDDREPSGRHRVMIIGPHQVPSVCSGDVLQIVLRSVSLELASPHFVPHERSFPWERYRMGANGA